MNHYQQIGQQISLRGLTTPLLLEMRKIRPQTSYYTLRKAFSEGPTTGLRQIIIETAQRLLSQQIEN